MPKKWILKDQISDNVIREFPDIPKALLQVLFNRNLKSREEIQFFLDPQYENTIYDPFLLPDMEKGIECTLDAIKNKQKLTIYADYDADAVTAAAVMIRALRALGAEVDYYIPDRFAEGYGVNAEAIKEIAKRGTKLIITVDCGVTAVDEVEVAKSLGVDVVITDHHHVPTSSAGSGLRGAGPEIIPQAVAVINQQRPDSIYPFKDLTGVGVAFKFVQGLLSRAGDLRKDIPQGFEKWLLDLVAIGTVADCQSLMGENRILVKYGLKVLAQTRWPGLKALLSVSGAAEKGFSSGTIGFQIAPRINAAGRLAHADIALKLLLTQDNLEAADLATQLENLNRKRQQLTESIMSEAREQLEGESKDKVLLFAKSPAWPKGIVGLVAGKLSEEFYRPVLIGSEDNDFTTGSARSIPGFSIIEALEYAGEHALKFGGHDAAAGFTVENSKVEAFYNTLLGFAEVKFAEANLVPSLNIDAELSDPSEFTVEFSDKIESLSPFGQGNPRPHFLFKGLKIADMRAVGNEGKHVQFVLSHSNIPARLRGIAFSKGYLAKALKIGDTIDMVGELLADEWNGNRRVQLKLIDWRKNEQNS
ncbi:MAG: single-stranded-DNA-specific exonuclease RecJ [Candidatus Doudnabacteria bacterium RIFCSPHIGHO2_02_FULL_46_11]|uniref:Single-stranded-DNA-specific exonuclease RecJ n=1 Tax=Candidatus Doudnabacteria bacterium RIFCSPHIGHO2_02_FULL_46_11 TaxID=1817832 RepID=A0A1F5P5D3_9BACT|nr:MAG: single-stranded-DNA-specific exonuclease RecJ [Candidatus Doudnabacteria bacterium RIFCSPHIGHO2_02_FULL_46_11]